MKKLQILTRHLKSRPNNLLENKQSISRIYGFPEYGIHTILEDPNPNGSGMRYANTMLSKFKDLQADWIWILDDDDRVVDPGIIGQILYVEQKHPDIDIIMAKGDFSNHTLRRIIPTQFPRYSPKYGDVGMSNFIVKDFVYKKHKHKFRNRKSGADFRFIFDVYTYHIDRDMDKIFWYDKIIFKTMGEGKAKGENAT